MVFIVGLGRFQSAGEIVRYIQKLCLKHDYDAPCWFSGKRGRGKSTLGLLYGRRVDPTFEPSVIAGDLRIAANNLDFLRGIIPLQAGQLMDGDELSLFGRGVMKAEQQALNEFFKDARGRNLIYWLKFPSERMSDETLLLEVCELRFHCYQRGKYQVLVPQEPHLRDERKPMGNWREVFNSTFPDLPETHPLRIAYRRIKGIGMDDSTIRLVDQVQALEDKKLGKKRSKSRSDPAGSEDEVLPIGGLRPWVPGDQERIGGL